LLRNRLELPVEKIAAGKGGAIPAGENQRLRVSVRRLSGGEELDAFFSERHGPSASLGLRIIKLPLINGLSNPNTTDFEIDFFANEEPTVLRCASP
jgi:hypothetical protein